MSGLGDDAQALLKASEGGDEPTAADRARVKAAVFAALAPSGGTGQGSGATPGKGNAAPPSSGVGAKALLSLAAIGAVGAGLFLGGAFGAPDAAPSAPIEALAAPVASPMEEAKAVTPPAVSVDELPDVDEPSPKVILPVRAEPTVSLNKPSIPAPAADPAPLPGAESTLAEETRRLRAAHKAMQEGDADAALAMLEEQEAKFTEGVLAEERAAARVIALCELGREAEGRAAADRFLSERPKSPLADRVRAACGH